MLRFAPLASLMVLALVGCKEPDEPPAPAGPPTVSDGYEPLAAGPGRVVSADGRIAAPVPAGPGWECVEEQHGDDEAAAVALRCRREDPREFLFFAAKTHRQPQDQRTDAHTVLMSLYRTDNQAFFDHVEYLSDGPATLADSPGWEAELEATHARLGPVRKRERLSIVRDRVYAISAEGKPELWAQHQAEIDRWFAEVRFAR